MKRVNRREFLQVFGLGAVGLGFSRLVRGSPGEIDPSLFKALAGPLPSGGPTTPSKHNWTMVIDLERCIGCDMCTAACKEINNVPDDFYWTVVSRHHTSKGREYFLSRPCMHCTNAPCQDVCPVGATYQRGDGVVVMDYDRCIGCRYCMVACPYGARSFNWAEPVKTVQTHVFGGTEVSPRARGVVEKCTFCVHRIDAGLAKGLTPGVDDEATPACVVACPAGARFFGDLNDPDSSVSQLLASRVSLRLREELGTGPRVYYLTPEGGL